MFLEQLKQSIADIGIKSRSEKRSLQQLPPAKDLANIPSQPSSLEGSLYLNEEQLAEIVHSNSGNPDDLEPKVAQFLEPPRAQDEDKRFTTHLVERGTKTSAIPNIGWDHPLLQVRNSELQPSDEYFPEHLFTPELLDIQKKLLRGEHNGVAMFYGGPLEMRNMGISQAWVTPVAVDISQELKRAQRKQKERQPLESEETETTPHYVSFHIIQLSKQTLPNPTLQGSVHLFDGPEIELKLDSMSDWAQSYRDILTSQDPAPRVIIRRVRTGMLSFPKIHEPISESEIPGTVIDDAVNRIRRALYIEGLPLIRHPEAPAIGRYKEYAEHEHLIEFESQMIPSEIGNIYLTPVQVKNDPWQYYEILSFEPLRNLTPKVKENSPEALEAYMQEMKRELVMRLDSGCDSGMLYHDQGCDCHKQLINALQAAKNERGFVIHIPLQDGRGYGMNTKMHTEALKHGGLMPGGGMSPPLTTIDAGKKLFGERYDIRTYTGVGKIVSTFFPHRNIRAITNNKRKIEEMIQSTQAAGVTINRRSADIAKENIDDNLNIQLADKRRSGQYFVDNEE